jgi:hypothetical protein
MQAPELINDLTPVVIAEEYVDAVLYYLDNIRESQFALGDLLVALVDLHGGYKAPVINYLAGKTNRAASTLYDYEAVSRRWTKEYRDKYAGLDYTIYRNSDPVLDEALLNKAADENMNPTAFKELKYPNLLEPTNVLRTALIRLNKIDLNGDIRLSQILKLLEEILGDML